MLVLSLLTGVGATMALGCQEVFGPVTSLYRYSSFDEAIADVQKAGDPAAMEALKALGYIQ